MITLPKENRRGMIIDGINTFDDLGLVMTERDMPPAPLKSYTVDIPGGHGEIDLTEAFLGDAAYENREMQFTFEYLLGDDIEDVRDKLVAMLHGRRKKFSFTFDEGYTYEGRFTVESTKTNGRLQRFVVKVNADPFKTKGLKTEVFNVSDGITVYMHSGRKRVKPVFEFSTDTIVFFEGERYVIPAGTHTINDVWFKEGQNEITFILAGIKSHITHAEMAQYTHEELRTLKQIWQWYKGIERHYVDEIKIDGAETPITGTITFTATDAAGNTITQALDLGDIKLARLGEEYDTVTIKEGNAVVRKIVDVADDGTMTLLPLPQSVTLSFPLLYSNHGEITSLEHDSTATVTYTTDSMNVELVMERATHADYMEGGRRAMTNEEMAQYTHAQLTMINLGTQEVTEELQESAIIQYEWSDL